MWYIDVELDGEYYRGVYFNEYRSSYTDEGSGRQEDNGYYTYTTYWFKYEPISWTVIEENDGYATLLCDMIIDSQEYDDSHSNTNYYESTVRAWLLGTFYETAFNTDQKQILCTRGDYIDYVTLLDYDDTYLATSSLLSKYATDYSMCQGLYNENSDWWLDIDGKANNYCMGSDGYVSSGAQLNYTSWGVVPVVTIYIG